VAGSRSKRAPTSRRYYALEAGTDNPRTQVQKPNLGHPAPTWSAALQGVRASGARADVPAVFATVPGLAAVAGSRWKRAPTWRRYIAWRRQLHLDDSAL
jgi:hypothetical protein